MVLHTKETEVNYSNMRFKTHFDLIFSLIRATSELASEEDFVNRVKTILKGHFGERSLINVTGGKVLGESTKSRDVKDSGNKFDEKAVAKALGLDTSEVNEDTQKIVDLIKQQMKDKRAGAKLKKYLEYMGKFNGKKIIKTVLTSSRETHFCRL